MLFLQKNILKKLKKFARNIYAAVKEANDGYIFSKSIHGKNLSDKRIVSYNPNLV